MKILFQGGFKQGRDIPSSEEVIRSFCLALANIVAASPHQIVFSGQGDYDHFIADRVRVMLGDDLAKLKQKITFLLPEREKSLPNFGQVIRLKKARWWLEERTEIVQFADALIAIGGGKGTADCIQKAFLAQKPVFTPCQIPGGASYSWEQRPNNYHYLREGDAQFNLDLTHTPEVYFQQVFSILQTLEAQCEITQTDLDYFKGLLRERKIEEVMQRLSLVIQDKDSVLEDQLILLHGSWKANQNNERLSLISVQESGVMQNRIISSLLQILQEAQTKQYLP